MERPCWVRLAVVAASLVIAAGCSSESAAKKAASTAPDVTPATVATFDSSTEVPASAVSVTTMTIARDTVPPVISSVTSNSPVVAENASGVCVGVTTTARISATVTDNAGLRAVSMTWTIDGVAKPNAKHETLTDMTFAEGSYQGTLGIFPPGTTVNDSTIVVTVKAADTAGNVTTRPLTIAIKNC